MNLKSRKKHTPWIVFEAKDWLDDYLDKGMKVFEWGSGGSTLYFCEKTKAVVSIEHNEKWYKDVKEIIKQKNINNCNYFFIEAKKFSLLKLLPYAGIFYNSKTFEEYKAYSFKDYVKKIDEFSDEYFDFIFVDGRSRVACLNHSLSKIRKGGALMLDNSERVDYQGAMNHMKGFERKDYFGKGPYIDATWQTTVWIKK